MPGSTGPLEPGTYIDTSLGVELIVTIPDGWEIANEPVAGVGVDLTTTGFVPAGSEDVAFLGFVRFDGDVFEAYCQPPGMGETSYLEQSVPIERSAQALVDHLMANPYLVTTEPEPVEIGGHSGLRLDATASVPDECATPVSHLWDVAVFGSWLLRDGMSSRYDVLDVGDEVIVIALERSPDVDDEAFAADAQVVLDSVTLTAMGQEAAATSPADGDP